MKKSNKKTSRRQSKKLRKRSKKLSKRIKISRKQNKRKIDGTIETQVIRAASHLVPGGPIIRMVVPKSKKHPEKAKPNAITKAVTHGIQKLQKKSKQHEILDILSQPPLNLKFDEKQVNFEINQDLISLYNIIENPKLFVAFYKSGYKSIFQIKNKLGGSKTKHIEIPLINHKIINEYKTLYGKNESPTVSVPEILEKCFKHVIV